MSPPLAPPRKFNVTFGFRPMLRIHAPGWLYTETCSPPSHRNPWPRERRARRCHGRQLDRLLTQVSRDASAELGALVDHAPIVVRAAGPRRGGSTVQRNWSAWRAAQAANVPAGRLSSRESVGSMRLSS